MSVVLIAVSIICYLSCNTLGNTGSVNWPPGCGSGVSDILDLCGDFINPCCGGGLIANATFVVCSDYDKACGMTSVPLGKPDRSDQMSGTSNASIFIVHSSYHEIRNTLSYRPKAEGNVLVVGSYSDNEHGVNEVTFGGRVADGILKGKRSVLAYYKVTGSGAIDIKTDATSGTQGMFVLELAGVDTSAGVDVSSTANITTSNNRAYIIGYASTNGPGKYAPGDGSVIRKIDEQMPGEHAGGTMAIGSAVVGAAGEYDIGWHSRLEPSAVDRLAFAFAPARAIPRNVPGPVLLGGFDGNNATNGPKQHPSAVGHVSVKLSTEVPMTLGFNPGAYMQRASMGWGNTQLDPQADDSNANAVVFVNKPLNLLIHISNTSSNKVITLKHLHWISKRQSEDTSTTITVTYAAGDLDGQPGIKQVVDLGGMAAVGHDHDLSALLADSTLAPGEKAAFTLTTDEGERQRLLIDNVALSGMVSTDDAAVNATASSPANSQDADYKVWAVDQSWSYGHQGTERNDDFDKDGMTNDQERIFGLDPTDASSSNPFVGGFDYSAGTFAYTRRRSSLTGLKYTVCYTTDHNEWSVDSAASQTSQPLGSNIEKVTVALGSSLLAKPNLSIQIRVQK